MDPIDHMRNAELGRQAAEGLADLAARDRAPQDAPTPSGAHRAELVTELRKGRSVRTGVRLIFLALVLLAAGMVAYYRYEQAHACDVARQVREHSEDLDRDVFTRLGQRFDIDQAEVDAFLADIGEAYDAMPEPAAC